MNSNYDKILEKAKNKYVEALKGRDTQDKLFSTGKFAGHRMAIDDLVFKRMQYQTEIDILESIFGKELKEIK